jgi:hypothetical protein
VTATARRCQFSFGRRMSRFIRVVPEWCAALSLNELADADCFPSSHHIMSGFLLPSFLATLTLGCGGGEPYMLFLLMAQSGT